jgi:hypothetical protein
MRFISYAHIDNQPLPTEKDGWVTLFHGRFSSSWRDDSVASRHLARRQAPRQ